MGSRFSEDNTGIMWTIFSNLEDLDYTDYIALLSHLETQMQWKISHLQKIASKIGLNINIKKTEVMPLKRSPKITT